jgi:aconitate hydratase
MAPEYGATCGIFPIDAETLRYLRLTGRSSELINLVEAYSKEQGWFHTPDSPEAEYTQTTELDLSTVEPSVAGPRRPQDRVLLSQAGANFEQQLPSLLGPSPRDATHGKPFAGRAKAVTPGPMTVKRPRRRKVRQPRSRSASGWMSILTWIMDPS